MKKFEKLDTVTENGITYDIYEVDIRKKDVRDSFETKIPATLEDFDKLEPEEREEIWSVVPTALIKKERDRYRKFLVTEDEKKSMARKEQKRLQSLMEQFNADSIEELNEILTEVAE